MQRHIHILGICGTFMGALAVLAKEMGFKVTGCDQNVYPPMSTYLASLGIEVHAGYDVECLAESPDLVIVGNSMKRGMAVIEKILDEAIPFISGPEWLYQNLLKDKKVIAVSGTHGKTTTTALIVKILDDAGLNPGFLIGGISEDFGISSRLTDSPYFVIEADEYDTAFFDKRSKFIHYHPDILVINNLEFDHGDIFKDIEAIYTQFHHLMRTLPSKTSVIYPIADRQIAEVLDMGCWSQKYPTGQGTTIGIRALKPDYSQFEFIYDNTATRINWALIGRHNAQNALHAFQVARLLGIDDRVIQAAFANFKGVKRRLECLFENAALAIYDDFAHHPTAVLCTLKALQARKKPRDKVIAIIEPRSNTMKSGMQAEALVSALKCADEIWFYQHPDMTWNIEDYRHEKLLVFDALEAVVDQFQKNLNQTQTDAFCRHYVIMSNGAFGGIHQKLCKRAKRFTKAS